MIVSKGQYHPTSGLQAFFRAIQSELQTQADSFIAAAGGHLRFESDNPAAEGALVDGIFSIPESKEWCPWKKRNADYVELGSNESEREIACMTRTTRDEMANEPTLSQYPHCFFRIRHVDYFEGNPYNSGSSRTYETFQILYAAILKIDGEDCNSFFCDPCLEAPLWGSVADLLLLIFSSFEQSVIQLSL